MTEIETKAIAIANKYVGQFSLEQKIKKLGEEVVELTLGIARGDMDNIKEELGDCFFLLLHIATTTIGSEGCDYYIQLAAEKMEYRKGTKISSQVNKL